MSDREIPVLRPTLKVIREDVGFLHPPAMALSYHYTGVLRLTDAN